MMSVTMLVTVLETKQISDPNDRHRHVKTDYITETVSANGSEMLLTGIRL